MKKIILTDCENHNVAYGVITVEDSINIYELQRKIYEIKNEFYNSEFDDWTVEDVVEKLGETYEFDYCPIEQSLEV